MSVLIGIPVFNGARTIGRLIKIIMRDPILEKADGLLAIYDDGSTDETLQILHQAQGLYGEKLYVFHSDQCSGKTVGLNWLASFAKEGGRNFICFIDADVEPAPSSLWQVVQHLKTCPTNHIVVALVAPKTDNLGFPLREIFEFKARTQKFRMLYRTYINGRAFAVRTSDFPHLPDNLICEDRYLTVLFTSKRIVPSLDAVIYYDPPETLLGFLRDLIKDQFRLIELAKNHKEYYSRLHKKRGSIFHAYIRSYPQEVKSHILRNLSWRTVLALSIERVLIILSKIVGESSFIFRSPKGLAGHN